MLRRFGIGVDNRFRPDLVRILIEPEVLVGKEGRRIVNASGFALLANLNARHDRVDARGGVIDIGDRAGRRNRLQVLVI